MATSFPTTVTIPELQSPLRALSGNEFVEGVQDGQSIKIPLDQLFALGKSAYQIAVEGGFVGTKTQWIASLMGAQGYSAYTLAQQQGFPGTLTQWLASLKGDKGDKGDTGDSAYQSAVAGGFQGNVGAWLATLVGPIGKSAYQHAVEDGFVGDVADWLLSLHGQTAYQVAQSQGFPGTVTQWLESLVGPRGIQGLKGDQGYGLKILGVKPNEAALPSNAVEGDAWIVGHEIFVKQSDGSWYNAGAITNTPELTQLRNEAISAAALAKAWANQTTGEVVAGQGFSAKKYALDAAASAASIEATAGSINARLDLLEYKAPAITSFLLDGGTSKTIEQGSSIPSFVLTWALTGSTPDSQSVSNGVGAVPVGTLTKTVTGTVNSNQTYTLTVLDTDPTGATKTATAAVSIVTRQKRYWGVSALTTLTSAQIIAMASEFTTSKAKAVTYDATGGRYPYFAYPASLGALTAVTVGGLAYSDYVETIQSFTNASGYTENYRVVRFNGIQTGDSIVVSWA